MFYRPHSRVTLDCGDIMMTKQAHKAECDIHNILRQYQRTGIVSHVQAARPTYEDLPDAMDYQAAIDLQLQAEAAFALLPSAVRDAYHNNAGVFLAALSDPAQEQQLRDFGVLKPKPPAAAPAPTANASE